MSDEAQVPQTAPPPPPATPPPPAVPPPPSGGAASENRTLWNILSYLWLLALIPFFVEEKDQEVRWHAKHGLVLTAAEVVVWILYVVFTMVAGVVSAGLASCLGCVGYLVLVLAVLAFRIMCIVKANQGQRLLVPGISDFADKF